MLKPNLHHLHRHPTGAPPSITRRSNAFITGDDISDRSASTSSFLSLNTLAFPVRHHRSVPSRRQTSSSGRQIKASAGGKASTAGVATTTSVKGVITIQMTVGGVLSNLSFTGVLDDITDLLGKSLLLELVAAEVDPKTGSQKATIKDYAYRTGQTADDLQYLAEFEVPEDFGEIGAVLIENEHHKEIYVESVALEGFPIGTINITCNSWVHPKVDNPEKRVFFVDKATCLPSQTPTGLKSLREKELAILRGDGVANGRREKIDRIYDYDVYNDLGDPDKNSGLARPVLGNKDLPYPRRCKTGRSPSKSGIERESSSG